MGDTVLVVEDDDDLLSTLTSVLTGLGFRVEGARDSAEAAERLRAHAPDVVLLDLYLDGRLCDDFLDALAESDNAPPVVLCSATHRTGTDLSSRYAVSFVAKPFDIDNLVEVIGEAHRTHRRPSRSMKVAGPR